MNNNNNVPSAASVLNATSNGSVNCSTSNANTQDLLAARMDASNQLTATDSFGDLGDMRHLDFNDLIGADGSLDNFGGKHLNEMVTDILHMDGMAGPQQNPTLGMSPTSLSSNQVHSHMDGGNMGSSHLIQSNQSEHNANEVDELLAHIQSIGNDAGQPSNRINSNLGKLSCKSMSVIISFWGSDQ